MFAFVTPARRRTMIKGFCVRLDDANPSGTLLRSVSICLTCATETLATTNYMIWLNLRTTLWGEALRAATGERHLVGLMFCRPPDRHQDDRAC
jgi:hypothetical protein